ncbi:lipoate--protein ligase family protein [Alkalibacillus haloalkaliphilus]|uniref:Octanoyl-[GcvH]:protein N-octanoyltransferase n=1 Tax=Alkalibacillus haloalkaliphilus TaxID=94136 RepID=A0A511W9J2_9BACI|nr:lipoate--protein ligase family protein [Alkalibacillus haloalkaliphilus]GEN46002.1 octanoyl-[GcvH]:protein N-octanoyltransferase [Alkalibacillus haloalkaliphilus]
MNHKLLDINQIRFIDHSDPSLSTISQSFATDDALCLSVSQSKETVMRYWVHEPTIVLGIPDSRLPHIQDGVHYLSEQGYNVIIRNSGGLAVALDEGVLNISLIFPDTKQSDIHDGYEAMVGFIKWLFQDEQPMIEAYEIEQSYCPGSYDLSINGQKFAGISQRRVKNGSAVQIYLCVEGDGSQRAELLKQFYNKSIKGEQTKFNYPNVNPEVMASLEQLLNKKITVSQIKEQILSRLHSEQIDVIHQPLNEQEFNWYESRLELMQKRNKDLPLTKRS